MKILKTLQRAAGQVAAIFNGVGDLRRDAALIREALGRIEGRQDDARTDGPLATHEFRVFSQWGEDGILRHLLRHVQVNRKVFVEFGVETYAEANTRWLLVNGGWSGLVIDGSESNIAAIRRDPIYWQHHIKAAQAFITRENIDALLREHGLTGEIGLLSVDIDGVDYWVWEAVTAVQPAIVVAEYNSLFGPDRAVTVPYDAKFQRAEAHYSHSYYGASLAALIALGRRKGMAFVGSNSAANNAFFVRRDLLRAPLRELTAAEGYVRRGFREARDRDGNLAFPTFEEEAAIVNALPLIEVEK